MITTVLTIALSILATLVVKAYLWPIAKRIVALRNRLYVVFWPDEGKEYCEEILADLHYEIEEYQRVGYSLEAIAFRILVRIVKGLPSDIALWAPAIPNLLVDKIIIWGDALRHYRVPNAMIAGVAALGLINYSLSSSSNNQPLIAWLFANGVAIGMTILVWKIKHPLVRRIFYSWMGVTAVAAIALMVWLAINYRLYESMTFKILMIAMVAVLPVIVVVDKSWRNRLFKSRWWLIPICWAPIIAGAFAGSLLIAGSIKPLLEMLATMALLAVGMLIVYGAIGIGGLCPVLAWNQGKRRQSAADGIWNSPTSLKTDRAGYNSMARCSPRQPTEAL